jgi:hypothetical protein
MDFFRDQKSILIFILLFMPGFVSTKVFDLMVPGQRRDYAKTIYEIVGYSFLTYALWSAALVPIGFGHKPPLWIAILLAIAILIVTPALLPIAFLAIVRKWFASHLLDPCPSSWDWAFKVNPKAMILVHLRDGRKVGGTWSRTAFSSSYPIPQDLFISEVWNVEQGTGRFLTRALYSKGLLIWGSDIEMIEFFELDETIRRADEQRKAAVAEAH